MNARKPSPTAAAGHMASERFKTEKGVPLPARRTRRGASKYPFPTMEVGDSFVAPKTVTSYCRTYGLRHGKKFSLRSLDGGLIRIWRVA